MKIRFLLVFLLDAPRAERRTGVPILREVGAEGRMQRDCDQATGWL